VTTFMEGRLLSGQSAEPKPLPASACGAQPGVCRFRRILVKSYVIAYREAQKHGDDPADYIRDCTRGSRDTIEPGVKGGRRRDPLDAVDIKVALEQVRDHDGIALSVWNVDRIAERLCSEHWNVEADR
jgi:hypothetical protein